MTPEVLGLIIFMSWWNIIFSCLIVMILNYKYKINLTNTIPVLWLLIISIFMPATYVATNAALAVVIAIIYNIELYRHAKEFMKRRG